ncbi:MAG: hypothetical protein ABDI07_10985, partial [Candidatus Kryptonium sp.]
AQKVAIMQRTLNITFYYQKQRETRPRDREIREGISALALKYHSLDLGKWPFLDLNISRIG